MTISAQRKSLTITYFDGLIRPNQTVITMGGSSQKDIVTGK